VDRFFARGGQKIRSPVTLELRTHEQSTANNTIRCVLVLALGVLFLVSNWCIKDAIRRGKSPLLVFIAVIFFFPWGWIAWLIFRQTQLNRRSDHLIFKNTGSNR
jgi:hypothetical protein